MNKAAGNFCYFVEDAGPYTHFSNRHTRHKKDALASVLLFCYNGTSITTGGTHYELR